MGAEYVIPKILAGLASITILTLVYGHLWALFKDSHFKWWTLGWSCYLARYALMFGMNQEQAFNPVVVIYASLAVLGSWLLWRGTLSFLDKRPPLWPTLVLVASYLWVFGAKLAGLPNWAASGPCAFAVAGLYLWNGLVLWRSRELEPWTRRLTGLGFMLWCLVQSSYPLYFILSGITAWSFLAAGAAEVWSAIGLLLLFTHAARTVLLSSQESLAQSEERLRRVLTNMPIMLYAFDERGGLAVWNAECERVTGYARDDLAARGDAASLLFPDDPVGTRWHRLSRPGYDFRDHQLRVACRDGERRTISFSRLARQVQVPGWSTWGVGMDVSQREVSRRELRRIAARVAHQFNNTLMALSSNLEAATLDLKDRPERAAELMQGSLEAVRQGQKVVRRLMARVGERRPDLGRLPASDLATAAARAVSLAGAAWGHLGADRAEITVNAPRGLMVRGELPELVDLVLAMLRVSLEAAGQGESRLEVSGGLEEGEDGAWAWLAVADNGPPAGPEEEAQLSDYWFDDPVRGGFGLNLGAGRGLARSLGGGLEPGPGHRFAACRRARLVLALPLAGPEAPTRSASESPDLGGTWVLVVEDESLVALGTLALLETAGARGQIAGDLENALERLESNHFDLVVCDLGLPDGSGWDLARHLAVMRGSPPVILLTGWTAAQVVAQPEAAPEAVWGILHKPVDRGELLWSASRAMAERPASGTVTGEEVVD